MMLMIIEKENNIKIMEKYSMEDIIIACVAKKLFV